MIKWFIRLGSAVGLLLIGFVLLMLVLGGGKTLSHTELSIEISRPAETIFPFLVEAGRMKRWMSALETLDTPSDRLQMGQNGQMVVRQDGTRYELNLTVTELAAPTRLKLLAGHTDFSCTTEYLLFEHDGTTTVTERVTSHYNDWFIRLLTPVFASDVKRALRQDLGRLAAIVQNESTVQPPRPRPGEVGFHGCCAETPEKRP